MALGRSRILVQGDTPHAHEREGIAFIEDALPNNDPYHVWELIELVEPSTGRQYEIDLIVLGFSAMYVVEIKSGPGRYTGDSLDWYRHPPGQRPRFMDPPLKSTNHKCKVLKSILEHRAPNRRDIPRIEPLVFLSHESVELDLRPDGMVGVVTRDTVIEALTHHRFPGSPPNWRGQRIDRPQMRTIIEAARAVGLRERKGRDRVGPYELGDVLRDGDGYQDRVARHTDLETVRRRARIYLVPQQTSVERRKQLLRAAEREATILIDVRGGRFVLGCTEYHSDAPRGPTVLFEDFEDGLPLDSFLRGNPDLSFEERRELVRQLAQALGYCHQRGVVHGAVTPDAVLARRNPESEKVEIRLYNFQLASSEHTSGTIHGTVFETGQSGVYRAPELREDPTAKTPAADVFGLGAVAYRIFTGHDPAKSLAEVESRLQSERRLDPRTVGHGLAENEALAEVIGVATAYAVADRYDDPLEWLELLEEELASTEAPAQKQQLSPLEAGHGDLLDGDLLVEAVLGEGASSRALRVLRESDNRSYALKVSLNEEQDPRLRAEAQVLERLRHPRIVPLIEERVIGGRVCLLLGLAGKHTLQRELAAEGSLSLEYAARYGEDLLTALELLEEHGIVHRDIKPANLGVGTASKRTSHLSLFDFSLASVPLTELGVGTAHYRDPFLKRRKRWDAAADHYSAAVTLHEMLSGSRARWGSDQIPADDERAQLELATASFDPALREQLSAFFERALARDAKERFESASAMRKAWERALEEPSRAAPRRGAPKPSRTETDTAPESDEAAAPAYDDAALAALAPDAPVEALPLGTRARNALDRAGIGRVAQVLALPDNRLSAIRGAGRKVLKEVHDFREAYARVHGADPAEVGEPFHPGYRGEARPLAASSLDASAATVFRSAGLGTLAAIAAAPKDQVQALAKRAGLAVKELRRVLAEEHKSVDRREHPATLEEWVAALLPAKKGKQRQYLESVLGLAPPFEGRTDVAVLEVAQQFSVTRANIYIHLGKCRERWSEHPALDELVERVAALVAGAGGAVPIERGAGLLYEGLPHDETTPAPLALAQSAALLRAAAEVDAARDGALRYARLPGRGPWVLGDTLEPADLARLGDAADALADREVPASPGEAARQLRAALEGSALTTLPQAQLISLACAAGKRAACSARLEIYPVGLAPERALALSAGVLRGALSPADVVQRVAARYPEAASLPGRPALDELLAPLDLRWDEDRDSYHRLGESGLTNLATQGASWSTRLTSATARARGVSPAALTRRDFDEQLRASLEADAFRVLGVSIRRAPQATALLAERHGLAVKRFDALFLAELEKRTASGKPSLAKVFETDGAGPGTPQWKFLSKLAADAAAATLDALVPAAEPVVIEHLSLTERFGLVDFLAALVKGAQASRSRSVFLLVPGPDTGGAPRIENRLAIPGLLPGQALRIPNAWFEDDRDVAA